MILWIDDEPDMLKPYVEHVRRSGFDVRVLSTIAQVEGHLSGGSTPECVFLDLHFNNERAVSSALTGAHELLGVPLFAGLRSRYPQVPIVVCSGYLDKAGEFVRAQRNCQFLDKGVLTVAALDHCLRIAVAGGPQRCGDELVAALNGCPVGPKAARQFENVSIRWLEFLFVPPFEEVIAQSRRADGRAIRDAVLPNSSAHQFWAALRQEFASNHIIVEFKNYSGPIGAGEVRQLQTYLGRRSLGRFGVLVSRRAPSKAALVARLDAYQNDDRLILFVDDLLLKEMIRKRSNGDDPADTLRRLKKEFELSY